jgi:hypothetical protein
MWVMKLPWVETMIWCDEKLIMVHCKMCNEIKSREKLLVPKFDNLQKQVYRRKCKVPHLRSVMGQYFMSIENQHAKNEHLWARKGWSTVVELA